MEFFKKYENPDGLLENLDSWVFVEWSQANSRDFVRGVNYPSNMMYYKMLVSIDKIWHTQKLAQKSERLKKNILKQLNGIKYFIKGNHDKPQWLNQMKEQGLIKKRIYYF